MKFIQTTQILPVGLEPVNTRQTKTHCIKGDPINKTPEGGGLVWYPQQPHSLLGLYYALVGHKQTCN